MTERSGAKRPTPRETWAALASDVGEPAAARRCVAMLTVDSPSEVADTLQRLGGAAADALRDGSPWKPYWVRVWGARGLLYVWDESCAPSVVQGLADEHWRVAEMCVKVCAGREIGAAGPAVAQLADHELARVRSAVARALGIIGDTEHLEVITSLLDDSERDVAAAAETALARMSVRLDLHEADGPWVGLTASKRWKGDPRRRTWPFGRQIER
jgi:hypothetical protein